MSFKPRFNTPSAAAKPQAGKNSWSDKPFFLLKCKDAEGNATLLAFMREQEGKFGNYMSGNELVLDEEGKVTKDTEGKTATTGSKFFFDPKNGKLKMKVGEETTILCEMKASDKFPGSFFGKDAENNNFYIDQPKKK